MICDAELIPQPGNSANIPKSRPPAEREKKKKGLLDNFFPPPCNNSYP